MFRYRVCRMDNGEQFTLPVDAVTGVPDPHDVLYLLHLRDGGLAESTLDRLIRCLGHARYYFVDRRIDLDERIAGGNYLTNDELAAFAQHCRVGETGRLVTSARAQARYAPLIAWIEWRAEPVVARTKGDAKVAAELALARFKERAANKSPGRVNDDAVAPGERLGLDETQRELFLRVIRPGDPGNPFRADLQDRNHVMLMMLYDLPLRAGEIAALYKADVDTRSNPVVVTIHRRPDNPKDPRKDRPSAKTRGRVLFLHDSSDIVRKWKDEALRDRDRFPLARKHPFFLVNEDGGPLSKRAARDVVLTLRKHHPSLASLCQHILRHTWNDRFVEAEDKLALSKHESEKRGMEQKYANGWSEDSTMRRRYTRLSTRKCANKSILAMQERSKPS